MYIYFSENSDGYNTYLKECYRQAVTTKNLIYVTYQRYVTQIVYGNGPHNRR